MNIGKQRPSILDKSLSRGKTEVSLTAYALLFSEMVQYSHNRVNSSLFGKEAEKLDRATDDERIYYLIEKEPLVNRFISVPRDKSSINCAAFVAGIVEAVLNATGFTFIKPAKVTALWHKGTTYMIKFDESVIARDKQLEGR
ncbi:Trafficking protein particle complex subunit 5 [Armadillidium vulgare]|nr:Trafficking protein particle complex subunit 5 [Armadillidium vulgare]